MQYSIWSSGSAEDYEAITRVSGEPIMKSMKPVDEESENAPNMFIPPTSTPTSAYELWQFQKQKRDLRQEYLEHWNNTTRETGTGRPVDAIIAPVAPYSAMPHGMHT